jgi:magnesium-transporting ATPase (P-type)
MVIRNGIQQAISVTELTVGDYVELSAGDVVPVDCLIFKCDDQFSVDESSMNIQPMSARGEKPS